jgi:cell division protein ZapA (FtsZ GTPase activity inhibitor)
LITRNVEDFREGIKEQSREVNEEVSALKEDNNTDNLEIVLMIASLVHMSNLYRRVAEKLVDEIGED